MIIHQERPRDTSNISSNIIEYILLKLYYGCRILIDNEQAKEEIQEEQNNNEKDANILAKTSQLINQKSQTDKINTDSQERTNSDHSNRNIDTTAFDKINQTNSDKETIEIKTNDNIIIDIIDSDHINKETPKESNIDNQFNQNEILNTKEPIITTHMNDNINPIQDYTIRSMPYATRQDTDKEINIKIKSKAKGTIAPFGDKVPSGTINLTIGNEDAFEITIEDKITTNLRDGDISLSLRLGGEKYNIFGKLDKTKSTLETGITLFKDLSLKVTEISMDSTKRDIQKMNIVINFDPVELTLNQNTKYKINKIKLNLSKIIQLMQDNDVCETSTSPSFIKINITLDFTKKKLILEIELTSAIKITLNFDKNDIYDKWQNSGNNILNFLKEIFEILKNDAKNIEFKLDEEILSKKIEIQKEDKQQYQRLSF